MARTILAAGLAMLLVSGCTGGPDVLPDAVDDGISDEGMPDGGADDAGDAVAGPDKLYLISFNTGTTEKADHSADTDGYNNEYRDIEADWFGNNLAWLPARSYIRAIVDSLRPDVLNFQELFFDPLCESICSELTGQETFTTVCDPAGDVFACSVWTGVEGSELTARAIVGPDYDVACAPGHNDNCIAVRKDFGTLAIADGAVEMAGAWIGGLDGMPPPNNCTGGARVATGVMSIKDGPDVALVDVHTVAGTNVDCRLAQLRQVFEDRGDGKPAAFGEHNIVMGDMNIDPFTFDDASVDYWNTKVGEGLPFDYISSDNAEGPMTAPLLFSRIDHVISNDLTGSCVVFGISEGLAKDMFPGTLFFDHRPLFCAVDLP